MVKIKICGLRRLEDIEIVNKYKPDFIGFVFAKSKRQISLEEAKLLKEKLDKEIKVVGVFVNESATNIKRYIDAKVIDYVQLHGNEGRELISELKTYNIPIIKAISVREKSQLIEELSSLEDLHIDYYLFDTYNSNAYGGSGLRFDWKLLEGIVSNLKVPYFLAGGIGASNIMEALEQAPFAIDLSSKLETNGFKDQSKIREVIKIVKNNKR